MPLDVVLIAKPPVITGNYAGSTESTSLITAVVYDYFGNLVEDDVILDWKTTEGVISPATTKTNSMGIAQSMLTAPFSLGTAMVQVTVRKEGGASSLGVTFTDKWVPANSPVFTEWIKSGAAYDCTEWSPSVSTVGSGVSFTQKRSCNEIQERGRQEREVSLVTRLYRNSGAPISETRVVVINEFRGAVGTKVNKQCYRGSTSHSSPGTAAVNWSADRKYRYFYQNSLIANTTATRITYEGKTYTVGRQYASNSYGAAVSFYFYELCVE